MSRITRLALKTYPPSFRRRYGRELTALVEDMDGTGQVAGDLLLGAVRMWLRPAISGRAERLQASLSTTWAAWCVGFLIGPAVNRALLDPPVGGVDSEVRALLDATYVLFFVGWLLALLGAIPIGWRAVAVAAQSRSWQVIRPLAPAATLAAVEAGGLVVLAATHAGRPGQSSLALLAGGALWLAGFAALIACLAVGPARSLERLELRQSTLRRPTLLALPVAVTLAALTACATAATVMAGHAELIGSAVPVDLVLVVGAIASLIALTSAIRGLHAARGC